MSAVMTTASGRTRVLPDHLDLDTAIGLDTEGRIVVQYDWMNTHAFGLTLCCDAFDKGMEDGVYCRACYGGKPNADAGDYLFRRPDGTFPGLDPVERIEVT